MEEKSREQKLSAQEITLIRELAQIITYKIKIGDYNQL